jgi:hypothetical protein
VVAVAVVAVASAEATLAAVAPAALGAGWESEAVEVVAGATWAQIDD